MAIKTLIFDGVEYKLSYELLNHSNDETILFLHGWGANKEVMKRTFSGCFGRFCHIYLDLPGFGSSSITDSLDSYKIQKIVEFFLKSVQKTPIIIIGHSFGGKVGLLLNPKYLVLLSSAGIVLPKRFFVKFKIAIFKIAKFLGLGRFYRFFASKDVAGMKPVMYDMFKKVVNEDMSSVFKDYNGTAFIFWGKNDDTTPLICAQKIESFIKNSSLFVLEGDHFFFLDKGRVIEKEIIQKV